MTCPFCGGTKEVMSLVSGNNFGGTMWSDTRRHYPMLPEVSPIQECPHCHKFYFIDQAQPHYSNDRESHIASFGKLGKLTYRQLMDANKQMGEQPLTEKQRWILNHELFMAYNECFRSGITAASPDAEEKWVYLNAIDELLEATDSSEDNGLFRAELLRELGRFDEAKRILLNHISADEKWVVDAMLCHIDRKDAEPFLLVENGEVVK